MTLAAYLQWTCEQFAWYEPFSTYLKLDHFDVLRKVLAVPGGLGTR